MIITIIRVILLIITQELWLKVFIIIIRSIIRRIVVVLLIILIIILRLMKLMKPLKVKDSNNKSLNKLKVIQ